MVVAKNQDPTVDTMTAKKVSVVIPTYNQIGLLLKTVECLRGQERINEVIVIDDGSETGQADAMDKITLDKPIRVIHNRGGDGFVRACNRGTKKSQEPYVLLLNSDCFLKGNAIRYMAENLDIDAEIVGARLLFAKGSRYGMEGTIQHAGIGFNRFGVPYHPMMNMPGDEPCVMVRRSINAVTGACMMVKREVWDKIGGLDNKFGNGVYDDADFCLSAKKMKYEVVYEPRAIGEHLMHGSQDPNDKTRNFFNQKDHDNNLALLFTKHGQPACDDHLWYRM